MLFSQRYMRILDDGKLHVELSEPARRKLWTWIYAHNSSLGVQRDPNDSWISNTSAIEEAAIKLQIEHGWDGFKGNDIVDQNGNYIYGDVFRWIILNESAPIVFDAIELVGRELQSPEREAWPWKINEIFELHDCPWRYADNEFFKLDADFVGARVANAAHETLLANKFAGATDEFARARRNLSAGDNKEAIYLAGHSLESLMKALTGDDQSSADVLIKKLRGAGFFDDLPDNARNGFTDQVLKALPFMRNRLGGHGQGAEVLTVGRPYAELAVQLAAAFHNFLIAKHLERQPPAPPTPPPSPMSLMSIDDDIPF